MAFLDDLGKTLTDMGKDAAQKTKDVVDVLQMKAQVSTEKSKLRELYAVIGKGCYEHHGENTKKAYPSTCEQVQRTLEKIADLEEKISRLDNTVTCPSCGAVITKGSAFCSSCGAPMAAAPTDQSAGQSPTPIVVEEPVYEDAEGIFEDEIKVEEES